MIPVLDKPLPLKGLGRWRPRISAELTAGAGTAVATGHAFTAAFPGDEVSFAHGTAQVTGHPFAAEPFTPLFLDGIQVWLDTAFYQNSDGTTAASASDPVGYWEDEESADDNATQDTTSSKPTLTASAVGTEDAVAFDSVDDYLTFGKGEVGTTGLFAASGEAFMVSVVFQTAVNGSLISRGGGVGDDRMFQVPVAGSSGTLQVTLRGTQSDTGVVVTDDAPHIATVLWDGTDARVWIDDGSATGLSVGTAAEETTENILLGARTSGNPAFFFGGAEAAVILCDEAPPESQITDLHDWADARWGIY